MVLRATPACRMKLTDSPMVDKSWTGILSTGVTYRF
ncbi:MltA-interacting protein [Salmonella enterica subsp. enterica]|uniref:MltA-interacting protein n=1 Tax=Salmonella enterica I TaxID=59201 RepID=A0A447U4R5_SALET|nr:MltA-interacting protein [Salmonella enterica subsp. enterica]